MAEVDDVFVVDRAEYKCCCGYMHVKTGAMAVALIGLALIIIRFFYLTWILFLASHPFCYFQLLEYIGLPFLALFFGFAILGIYRQKKSYLLPLLLALFYIAIFCFFTAIFSAIGLANDWGTDHQVLTSEHKEVVTPPITQENECYVGKTVPFLAILLTAFYTFVALNVVVKCYLYLRHVGRIYRPVYREMR
ncbi:hypothetical protein QR680_018467 [Steinernema hermaphroditum]|uniref:Uncharacterized protein n=1 Tax=Steinernema hermaphroditum TaxID=289476 RepID=A0AA39HI24_9BILA|nr:hypothetical protein QR680_018467 [Steinernema hermaphroditum]